MSHSIDTKRPIPRKLNNSMITALAMAVSKGYYNVTACALCGIQEPTLYYWLNLAQKDYDDGLTAKDSIYISLDEALKKAEGEAEAEMVAVIRESATVKREWLPAMVYLERRHRERWGRPAPVQIHEEHKTIIFEVIFTDRQKEITDGEDL